MSDILDPSFLPVDAEQETTLNQLFAEIQRLNALMGSDQADINRLKIETRILSAHSDHLLMQIESQLNALQRTM